MPSMAFERRRQRSNDVNCDWSRLTASVRTLHWNLAMRDFETIFRFRTYAYADIGVQLLLIAVDRGRRCQFELYWNLSMLDGRMLSTRLESARSRTFTPLPMETMSSCVWSCLGLEEHRFGSWRTNVITTSTDPQRYWRRSNVVNRGWSRLTASARMQYWNLAMLDFWDCPPCSHTIDDFLTSLTTVGTHQWGVHLRLHSSRPPHTASQRICGGRPATARIWVWLHTGWTTGTHNKCLAIRLALGSHTADFIWRNSATVPKCIEVDRRGCLNKHQPPLPGRYWHFARPEGLSECIGLPWNVTLITARPSLCLLLMPTALSANIAADDAHH